MKCLPLCAAGVLSMSVAFALLWPNPVDAGKKKPPTGHTTAGYDLVVLAPPGVEIRGSNARDLDELGNVVGYYRDADSERNGFHYDRVRNEYVLFGPGVEVSGLNNSGEMVGTDWNSDEGLYWSSLGGQPIPLDPAPGHLFSAAFKINDAGVIIGDSLEKIVSDPNDPDYPVFPVAVAWAVNRQGVASAPLVLPFPAGAATGAVRSLSNEDANGITRIVGYAGISDPMEMALQWEIAVDENGPFLLSGPIDLGSLAGFNSAAYGVNSRGDIVGKSGVWPFVKPNGEAMQELPGLRKATNGYAGDVNDAGAIVGSQGYLSRGIPVFRAVLWPNDNSIVDLNRKVALAGSETLEDAFRINHSGEILASGFFPSITEVGNVGCLLVPAQ